MSYKWPVVYGAFLVVNVLIALWRIRAAVQMRSGQTQPADSYDWYNPAYADATYPMLLPLPPTPPVALTLHDTVRFGLNASALSAPTDDDDWETIMRWADGYGRVRLGPARRLFVVSFYHQLHCLRGIQRGLVAPNRTDGVSGAHAHLQHCVNYLRQTLLCMAGAGLERGDFLEGRRKGEAEAEGGRVGGEMVCRDWEVLVDAMQDNYDEFEAWAAEWN